MYAIRCPWLASQKIVDELFFWMDFISVDLGKGGGGGGVILLSAWVLCRNIYFIDSIDRTGGTRKGF
jgi:hypothetical protein